jgi:hypothetical protein
MSRASTNSPEPTSRREAIALLASGVAAVAAGCAPPPAARAAHPAAAAPAATGSPASGKWDMSWRQRVTHARRTVFDTNEVQAGAGLGFVAAYLEGVREAYGPADGEASAVLVLRHQSVPIALDDAMWMRMGWGESLKLKDPSTGETALRNPFVRYATEDRFGMLGADGGLEDLVRRGTVVLACNRALGAVSRNLAAKESLAVDEARRQVMAAVLPGVYVMPNGVFAVCTAQELGCGYIAVR